MAQLVLSGNQLYGTTEAGGFCGNGIIFAINTDGTGFTNLHNFTAYACGARVSRRGSGFPRSRHKDSYWRWPQRDLAGNAIDFFMRVLGLSFHQAMLQITGL